MIRRLRAFGFVDGMAAVYALVFFAWLVLHQPGTDATHLADELFFLPLGLVCAWAFWRNSTYSHLDRQTRLAWRLLAASSFGLWISGSTWILSLRFSGNADYPAWVDTVETIQALVAIVGFATFPHRKLTADVRTRALLDTGVIAIAGLVLAFFFGLRLWLLNAADESVASAMFTLGTDWVAFVVIAIGFKWKRDETARTALGLLLAANVVYLIGNGVYTVRMATYQPGDFVDGLWFAAWVFRWIAARVSSDRYRRERDAASGLASSEIAAAQEPSAGPQRYESGVFSYLVVAGAFVLLVGDVLVGEIRYVGLLASATAAMAVLLFARQVAELRENRRLFDARLAQETWFRSLVQNSSDVVIVLDAAGVISYVSPSASRIFGPEHKLRVGARLDDVVVPDDRSQVRSLVDGDATPAVMPLRLPYSMGKVREVDVVCSDLRNEPGVRGIVLNCRDVTERNDLERALRHAQKLDVVKHLAGGLAHDLNNVLSVVRGYAEMLREDLPEGTPAADDVRNIEKAVAQASAVTKRMLALHRKQPTQRVVIDLNAVVRELQPMVNQIAKDRVRVVIDCAPDLWSVEGDPGQIEQVILNLATNACDAMPEGGELRISTANRVVTAVDGLAAAPGGYAAVIVSDQGTGIPADIRDKIFEPFFSTKSRERGMGLGLAMVQGIVSDAGGSISVDSIEGRGSTFTILLPRTERKQADAALRQTIPQASALQRSVLLVDDEPDVRAVARKVLARAGFSVIEAQDGPSALALAAAPRCRIDVMLTDLLMPGMHGRELVARFAAIRPGVPIVCMSGFTGTEQEEHLPAELVSGPVVGKPFTVDALVRAVSDALTPV